MKPLDDCLRVWVPALNLRESAAGSGAAVALGLVEQVAAYTGPAPVFVTEDREFGSASNLLRKRVGIGGERISEGIEGGSQVVQRITDQEAEWIGRWSLCGGIAMYIP